MNFVKLAKLNSINKLLSIFRWSTQRSQVVQRIHTSRGNDQIVIKTEILNIFLPVLNHGDYEWQDPKSEDEV